MKTPFRLLTLLAALALAASSSHSAQDTKPLQSWTATDGRVIQARFVKMDGESVVIEWDGNGCRLPTEVTAIY
ncbi:MAG: hypothetical protein NTW21_24785 [Verrucomicrobia bacterium]|nr:hypothetical protein [Verrucomicrobiota bacterium]